MLRPLSRAKIRAALGESTIRFGPLELKFDSDSFEHLRFSQFDLIVSHFICVKHPFDLDCL
jgi:hypothetical protein